MTRMFSGVIFGYSVGHSRRTGHGRHRVRRYRAHLRRCLQPMLIVESNGSLEGYLFRLWCSKHAAGWAIDSAQIWRHREALLPKRRLGGAFSDQQEAVAYGVKWCELILRHLLTAELPPPDPEFLPMPGAFDLIRSSARERGV